MKQLTERFEVRVDQSERALLHNQEQYKVVSALLQELRIVNQKESSARRSAEQALSDVESRLPSYSTPHEEMLKKVRSSSRVWLV